MGLLILTDRHDVQNATGGSSIRIKGYSMYLDEFGVRYVFMAPVKPSYVPADNYQQVEVGTITKFLIKVYLVIYKIPLLPFLIRTYIKKDEMVKKVTQASAGRVVWAHQNGQLATFLKLTHNRKVIYDVHGVLGLQWDYFRMGSVKKKILFLFDLMAEKTVFRNASLINVTTQSMKHYIAKKYHRHMDEIIIAKEGTLRENSKTKPNQKKANEIRQRHAIDPEKDIVLFYAGNFKKMGGVHLLTDVFCDLSEEIPNLKLFLIGNGQMYPDIIKKLSKTGLIEKKRATLVEKIDYDELVHYQSIASFVVNPGLLNKYMTMTTNIKDYDSLASMKPLFTTKKKDIQEEFPENKGCIRYFRASDKQDMKNVIKKALTNSDGFKPLSAPELEAITYRQRSFDLIKKYKELGLICTL